MNNKENPLNDERMPHKKKAKKRRPSKSNHKHVYRVEMLPEGECIWFTHREVCVVCGRVGNEYRKVD